MILGPFGMGFDEAIIVLAIVLIVYLAIYIPYCLTLQRALESVSPDLRKMAPGLAWLMLIPFFSYVWVFILNTAIADSFDLEYRRRGIPPDPPRPTYNIGLTYGILAVVSGIGNFIPDQQIKMLFGLVSLGAFVLWIVYWVQVAAHKNKLNSMTNMFGGAQQYYQPNYGNAQYYQQPNANQQQQPNYGQQYQQPNYGQQQYPNNQQPYFGGAQQNPPPQQNNNPPTNDNTWAPPKDPNNPPPFAP